MPPQRSTAKTPVKTERTHEENQERAYIAASRRSDRSLEARIESARRASEIHKKRTGRGLRVTEEDVVNEEMYEEEDDDGPGQMRRMQAYLAMTNTSGVFDGRLNSYLMSQMATRNMLLNGGAFNPNMNPNQPTTFFSYTPPHTNAPCQMQSPSAVQPRAMAFPPPQSQQQRMGGLPIHNFQKSSPMMPKLKNEQNAQQTSGKGATPKTDSPIQQSPVQQSPLSQVQSPIPQSPDVQTPSQSFATPNGFFGDYSQSQQSWGGTQYSYPNSYSSMDPMGNFYGSNMDFMSASLPVEAQQMFGTNTFDPSDPRTAHLMNQNHGMPVPPNGTSYNYNLNLSSMKNNQDPSPGMNQTLSPSNFPGNHNLIGADGETSSAFTNNYSFNNFSQSLSSTGTPTNEWGDIFDAEGAQNYS